MNIADATRIPDNFLERAVTKAIQDEITKEVAKAIEEAKKQLEIRIPEIVAGVALRCQKNISMSSFGSELTIRIQMGEKP